MIGRDRDVVDVLVTHGWFARGWIPNGSVSRLHQDRSNLAGLFRNQRVCHHVFGESWTGVVTMFLVHHSRQTVCFTGGIPTELGHLSALIGLSLRKNQLTGV